MEKKPRHFATSIAKRQQAKFLIVRKGMSYKDTAKAVGVTGQTMGKWVKQYGWMDEMEALLKVSKPFNSLMEYMVFISNKHPKLYNDSVTAYEEFINEN